MSDASLAGPPGDEARLVDRAAHPGRLAAYIAIICVASWTSLCSVQAVGQDRPAGAGAGDGERTALDAVARGKRATGLVLVGTGFGIASGSAFCIDAESALFLTNAHVVADQVPGTMIKLVLDSGLDTQRLLDAEVLRRDDENDLALLRVRGEPGGLTALELGREEDLTETMEVLAYGFPLGVGLAVRDALPNITVSVGRITSLRRAGGRLALVQFDASVLPGNSGGPVLDRSGRVIGVVFAGVVGAPLNFAIPAGRIDEMLRTPVVVFDPPALPVESRHDPQEWAVRLVTAGHPDPDLEVAVVVGEESPRTLAAERVGEGRYRVRLVPIPPGALQVVAHADGVEARGQVGDIPLTVGGERHWLGDLSRVRLGDVAGATTLDGRPLAGRVEGLGPLRVTTPDGSPVELDPSRIREIEVVDAGRDPLEPIDCAVIVRDAGRERTRVERLVEVRGPEGLSPLVPRPPSPPEWRRPAREAPKVIMLGARLRDACMGGGGRYLLLGLEGRKLAVFDLFAADLAGVLEMSAEDFLVAGGAEKFVVVSPERGEIQRWDLGSLAIEESRPLPFVYPISGVTMGAGSRGPILIAWEHYSGAGSSYSLINLATLQVHRGLTHRAASLPPGEGRARPRRVDPESGRDGVIRGTRSDHPGYRDRLRSSLDGRTIAIWEEPISPTTAYVLGLSGRTVLERTDSLRRDVGALVPGPDGRVLYSGRGGLLDQDLRALGHDGQGREHMRIPSTDPLFYLGIGGLPWETDETTPTSDGRVEEVRAVIYGADGRAILPLGRLPEMAGDYGGHERRFGSALTPDRRFSYIPQAGVLVLIPPTDDRLIVRPLAIREELDRLGIDYLYVDSEPARQAVRGWPYRSAIRVQSRRGGPRFTLVAGPDGMTVGPDGTLSWQVPDAPAQDPVEVVVSIRDVVGREIRHAFEIEVR